LRRINLLRKKMFEHNWHNRTASRKAMSPDMAGNRRAAAKGNNPRIPTYRTDTFDTLEMPMKLTSTLMLGSIVLSGCANLSPPAQNAVAELKPTQGNTVSGTTTFVERGDKVLVEGRLTGLPPGLHGFHVHEKGDCSAPDASSAGAHFNPTAKAHGNPLSGEHHVGDLGNVTADAQGNAVLVIELPVRDFSLANNAPDSIVGRSLIVHADPDDLKTQPAGNSGKRVACGVITLR
jgi:Cu-Zn family superoxide dismutase